MTNKVYLTGDTHGGWRERLSIENFPIGQKLTRRDYVIILGDFGYWHDTLEEQQNLDWLNWQPWTTLFIDGNHENFDRLNDIPVQEWHGGKVHKLRTNVIHLMRGEIFNIGGKSFFTMGGAQSQDIKDGILEIDDPRLRDQEFIFTKSFRVNHRSWWKEELPSPAELQNGLMNLAKVDNKVDFILTHEMPLKFILFNYPHFWQDSRNDFTIWLDAIDNRIEYDYWYCGHYHDNTKAGRCICLYDQIERIL